MNPSETVPEPSPFSVENSETVSDSSQPVSHDESSRTPLLDGVVSSVQGYPQAPIGRVQASSRQSTAQKASYLFGFGLSFSARLLKGLVSQPKTQMQPTSSTEQPTTPVEPAESTAAQGEAMVTTPVDRPCVAQGEGMPQKPLPSENILLRTFNWIRSGFAKVGNWFRERISRCTSMLGLCAAQMSSRGDGVWEYILVTLAYWGLTITDGAIRMLVLFQFYLMGYTAFQIASLFLLYEVFGVVTNLFGGWIGANFGLRVTLFGGLGIQIFALAMLAFMNPAWPAWLLVGYVMVSQALSGIAKDLTKMSSKSAIKAIIPADADATMYRWVSLLTGSKNALKGVGFFVGALLLTLIGFQMSLLLMSAALAILLYALWEHLPDDLGRSKEKAKFKSMFSQDHRVNILSAARFFLFGARDVWFVVALPVYLAAMFGWSPLLVGAYLALWTIGYGIVQSVAPRFIAAKKGEVPKGHTVFFWSLVLTAVPAGIALALGAGFFPQLSILGGLAVFGVVFAANSAVHSYMIVNYAESEKVAMTIGFYYMANAGGRLVGTVLSGWIYQVYGIVGCLWVSAIFAGQSTWISSKLTFAERGQKPREALPPPMDLALPA